MPSSSVSSVSPVSNPADTAMFNGYDAAYAGVTDTEKLMFIRDYLNRRQNTLDPVITEALVFFESCLWHDLTVNKRSLTGWTEVTRTLSCAYSFRGKLCGAEFPVTHHLQKYCEEHRIVHGTGKRASSILAHENRIAAILQDSFDSGVRQAQEEMNYAD